MITIGDNNCKLEANFQTVSELMAKKRKLYLHKRAKSLDANCETTRKTKNVLIKPTTARDEDILPTSQTTTNTTTLNPNSELKCFLQHCPFTSGETTTSEQKCYYDYNSPELRISEEKNKRLHDPLEYNNNCSCQYNCHNSYRSSKLHQHQLHYCQHHHHYNVLKNKTAQESSMSSQLNSYNISNNYNNQEIYMQNSYYLLRNNQKQDRMSSINSAQSRVCTTETMPELDPKLITSTTHRTCSSISKCKNNNLPYPRCKRRFLLTFFYYNIIMILKTLLDIFNSLPTIQRFHRLCHLSSFFCEKLVKRRKKQQSVDNDNSDAYNAFQYDSQQKDNLLKLPQRLTHSNDQKQQRHCNYNSKKRKSFSSTSSGFVTTTILLGITFLSFFVPLTQALTSDFETTLQSSLAILERSAREIVSTTELEISESESKEQVRLTRPEHVCKSLDIRNSAAQFHQLENCTVIEGFLLITLLNGNSLEDYNETFPLLTEVTDFIIVYQVHYLRSLGRIFPNLSVIRGRVLFEGYALIVYSNSHLEELGLTKLTTISRGGVRIEKNVMLCFVNSIKWDEIVSNNTDTAIKDNRDNIECPTCPGDQWNVGELNVGPNEVACKEHYGRRYCWNSKICQKFCPKRCRNNCIDENTCCNESCLGGCSPDNVNECISCRNFSIYNTTCTDKCPENYYKYLDRRCLTAESCNIIGTKYENNRQEVLVAYEGSCSTVCPEGYIKVNMTCVECGDKCIKKCQGGLIDSVARARELHGCTHIVQSPLVINIKRGGRHLMEDLAYGLSSIVTIETALKIQGTYGLFDLKFFKNLQIIEGEKLIEDEYAFYVLENTDMETIWNPNQTVQILKGTVYFHFNPKLCLKEINSLLPMLNKEEFDQKEVSKDSNGSRGSCNTTLLNVTLTRTGSLIAIVEIENPILYEDQRTFIGYQFLHIEDPLGNATEHAFRPCEDGWEISEPTKSTIYLFQNLKPYTRYSYYVKTLTISTERRNGQSRIQHFTTKSDQPKNVNKLQAYANSSYNIVMNWLPPTTANGKLIKYKIRAVYDKRIQRIESRNYCKDPLKEISKPEIPIPTITEKPVVPKNCNCKKPSSQMYDEEEIDASIHASIELENALQNFVYVKKENKNRTVNANKMIELNNNRNRRAIEGDTFDSFLLRHIRDVPAEVYKHDTTTPTTTTSTTISTSGGFTTTVDPHNDATLSFNETRMDPEGEYYEVVVDSVNASSTEFVFTKLKHFSWYMLGVEACREKDTENDTLPDCSIEVKTYVRTLKLENVDRIVDLRAELETTNSSRSNIRIFWVRPPRPNGAVVSYTILYMLQSQDAVEEKKCITEVDFVEMGYQYNGYVLTGLSTGNYTIRIRTNTLAGEGQISKTIYIDIPPITMAPSVIIGITVGTLSALILIGVFVYYLCRKRILAPPSDLKIFPSVNPHYISLQYIPDEWEVARDQVIQLSPLGQGSFGMVYEGILKGYKDSNLDIPCAIKTVNENATDRERMNFLNEACVMKQFDTYHVVRLLGVCSRGQPALVVMELMKNGDLKSYLRAHRPDERDDMGIPIPSRTGPTQPPKISRIYQMAIEIADGMAYLAAKKFVHRDLAARNCMVAADLTVKIGDFGMTRDIYENDYYRKGTKGLLPVRWMPPESLRDGVYSTASDVFSYGVVLWEMATLASQPYQGLSNDQVLRYVIDGGVMERPENCPDKLYSLMQKCWHHRPSARPTFMEIIRYLLELAEPHFSEVSFFHSDEGQQIMKKEFAERNQSSGDVFDEHENDMEDVTTPLRLEEYSGYKVNMDINSSVEHRGDSSMVMDDDAPHSPYSLTGSPMVISSTPDEQLRNSYNMSRIVNSHNPILNSAPSTSADLRKGGPSYYTHPHTHPHHRNLYQPTRYAQQQQPGRQHRSADVDAYVLPDFELKDLMETKRDSDEQGYEMYDPSPNYSEKVQSNVHDDDEDDMGVQSTAGQNLLARSKPHQKQPIIMPLSSSMPDEVIGQPATSSLHPSTASAASSNTSSKTGAGKYQGLRAVADSLGNNVTAKFRSILFNTHKRSGSNASHKSTSSNPNTAGVGGGVSGSSNNLTRGGRGKSMSGQNLGTIESGGSGSAGSYCANPRFFVPNNGGGNTSDNPNYKRLDEGSNDTITNKPKMSTATAFSMSSNPNYHVLDESLNTTSASTSTTKPITGTSFNTSDNPNYQLMQAPATTQKPENSSLSYVMMNEPKGPEPSAISISDNPNYQIMGPTLPTAETATTSSVLSQKQPQLQSQTQPPSQSAISRTGGIARGKDRFLKYSSSSSAVSTSSSHETDEDDDLPTTTSKGMKSDRIPLSRRSSNDRSQKKKHINNRSRSQSSSSSSRSSNTATTTSQHQSSRPPIGLIASSTLLKKENWLKQQPTTSQSHQQQQPPPPPNGFVGRETS